MLFTQLYQGQTTGCLCGLDRVRFRGTDRLLSNASGFAIFLSWMGILLKDFGRWAQNTTKRLREECAEQAQRLGIEVRYLRHGGVDKEALAREIAQKGGMPEDGSICLLSVVELCYAPTVVPNQETKKLEVRMLSRKCIFLYYYFDDPGLGFGHVRLQTWAPFTVQICLNGRHWLEKQLLKQGVAYLKAGNCFPWVQDVALAQHLLDEQLKSNWPQLLNGLVNRMCPTLPKLCSPFEIQYYWSADETEFATDVMFRSAPDLDKLFPALVLYGMRISDCSRVLTYFGRPVRVNGAGKVPNQVETDCRKRHEGLRLKHLVNGDSIKMYNKAGNVLRTETTINNARNFKAFRHPNDDETKPQSWQRMRKGVADLHRRCEVSKNANERYLNALSTLQVEETLREVTAKACNKTTRNGRPVRALNPWNEQDYRLLLFLAKPEWAVNGFRNANLCQWLQPRYLELDAAERRKLSAKATRLIGMLRAHSLIAKVPKENRYTLSQTGLKFATALLVASAVTVKQLTGIAA